MNEILYILLGGSIYFLIEQVVTIVYIIFDKQEKKEVKTNDSTNLWFYKKYRLRSMRIWHKSTSNINDIRKYYIDIFSDG